MSQETCGRSRNTASIRAGWLFRTGKTGEFPDWIGIRPAEQGNFWPILRQFWLIKLAKVTICTKSIKDAAFSGLEKIAKFPGNSENRGISEFRQIRGSGEFRNSGKSGKPASDRRSAGEATKKLFRTGVRPARPKFFSEIATLAQLNENFSDLQF